MSRTWLVGYDFSDCSEAAVEAAAADLAAVEGRLVLLHAYHLPIQRDATSLLVSSGAITSWDDVQRAVEETIERRLELRAASIATRYPAVRVEARAVRGFPEHTILEIADEVGADRIVLGTHGRTGLKHLLLGSVAARVARMAHVPVLIVKAPHMEPTEDGQAV